MNNLAQMQTTDGFIQIDFRIKPCDKEDSSIYLSEFSKLTQGIVEIHNCLAIHAHGQDFKPQLELLHIQMNSPIEFSLGVFKDIADAFIKLLKIPIEIIKGKKEIEEKQVEIQKKREEANMLQSQSQHQQNIQSIEIQSMQVDLDKKRMELAAYGHEKIREVLESLSSLNSNPQAAQLLAEHSKECINGIGKLLDSNLPPLVIDIKPIYKDTDAPVSQQLASGGDDEEIDEKNQ